MTSLYHPPGLSTLWHLIEVSLSRLRHPLGGRSRGRRLHARGQPPSVSHLSHQHFGALDDQLLSDLGLQRSEIRAAEYGILPGDQALHQEDDERPEGGEAQPRAGA